MTAQAHAGKAMTHSGQCRKRRRVRKARQQRILSTALAAALIVSTVGCMADVITQTPAPEATVSETVVEQEPVLYRDDIVTDGRLLSYECQEIMQDCSERYDVPYALLLAVAEVETHFDPDAVSPTNDYGLMQINEVNHDWLMDLGFDVQTYAGNIEAATYLISDYFDTYGSYQFALMAYNCGPTGAKRLWSKGICQTNYTSKVMTAYDKWTAVLEG